MKSNRVLLLVLVLNLFTIYTQAQPANNTKLSAKEVITAFLNRTGGVEKWQQINTFYSERKSHTFYADDRLPKKNSYKIVYRISPYSISIKSGDGGHIIETITSYWFKEEGDWNDLTKMGWKKRHASKLMLLGSVFARRLADSEMFSFVKDQTDDLYYCIKMKGNEMLFFFSKEDVLLRKTTQNTKDYKGVRTFEKYKWKKGFFFPMQYTICSDSMLGKRTDVYTYSKIKFNIGLDENIFKPDLE